MICGFCALERCAACNGLCRASYAFCACASRHHQHPALSTRTAPSPPTLAHLRQSPNAIDPDDEAVA